MLDSTVQTGERMREIASLRKAIINNSSWFLAETNAGQRLAGAASALVRTNWLEPAMSRHGLSLNPQPAWAFCLWQMGRSK